MKALSLWQPWAALMAVGAKRIETRHWSTAYRGELAIHAAKRKVDIEFLNECPEAADALSCYGMWYGAIVAVVDLYDVNRTEDIIKELHGPEILFGNYSPNRFGWLTKEPRQLKNPVFTRGFQSLWTLPQEIESQVRAQL